MLFPKPDDSSRGLHKGTPRVTVIHLPLLTNKSLSLFSICFFWCMGPVFPVNIPYVGSLLSENTWPLCPGRKSSYASSVQKVKL